MTSESSDRPQADALRRYHEYLERNYQHGVDRFFSPTGSLEAFQRKTKVSTKRVGDIVVVRSVDEAVGKLRSIVEGGSGVFDLSAEPGTGKTSVLPFRFGDKRVVVALPTPFEAWSAYQMATGPATLRLKGLKLGKGETVCYMDSYMAANMVLSGFIEYDVLIVDECDSGKGVTKFLSEVATDGKVIIRMSASLGRTQSGPSRAFPVAEHGDLPDPRGNLKAFVSAVKSRLSGRALVLMPDAVSAREVHEGLKNSLLISSSNNLSCLLSIVEGQSDAAVYVADDVCARGISLNLDTLIDSQLVTEHGVTRHITDHELYQRKGRLGRNKPGAYHSPGLSTVSLRESEADLLRNNVMCAISGLDQYGPSTAHLTEQMASELLCSEVEPIIQLASKLVKKSDLEIGLSRKSSVSSNERPLSSSSSEFRVQAPSWMSWMHTAQAVKVRDGKHYLVRSGSRSSSGSDGVVTLPQAFTSLAVAGPKQHSRSLPAAVDAPYASRVLTRDRAVIKPLDLPVAPPTVDLTELQYDMDWPAVVRDCVANGVDLPTIVPPNNWRHTSAGGMGTDWFARLDALSVGVLNFTDDEFEVVCRTWNKMVAMAWVKRTPGLSSLSNEHRIEFCVRYFQSYYQLSRV